MSDFIPVVHRYTTSGLKMVVNAFLVETENGVVAIDSATALSSSGEMRALIDGVIKKPLLAVLLTHGHPDHYVGAGALIGGRGVPLVSTQGTLEFAKYQDGHKIRTLQAGYGGNFPEVRRFPDTLAKDGDALVFDGVEFALDDYGACESEADSTWTVNIGGVKHVFCGDLVYNRRHCYFRDGYALRWLDALDKMLRRYDHRAVFHPGHGEDGGPEMIFWQKAYIQAFLYNLKSLLGGRAELTAAEQETLFDRMRAFLPDETIIFLLKYEPEETIKALRAHHALD